jgi:hypothetical protein
MTAVLGYPQYTVFGSDLVSVR